MACSTVKFAFTFYLHSNTSRHFRNIKKEYLKAKIDELETKNKIKKSETCTGTSMLLRRVTSLELIYSRMRRVIWLDSHSILAMGRNHFSQLFNVHGVSDVRQK